MIHQHQPLKFFVAVTVPSNAPHTVLINKQHMQYCDIAKCCGHHDEHNYSLTLCSIM